MSSLHMPSRGTTKVDSPLKKVDSERLVEEEQEVMSDESPTDVRDINDPESLEGGVVVVSDKSPIDAADKGDSESSEDGKEKNNSDKSLTDAAKAKLVDLNDPQRVALVSIIQRFAQGDHEQTNLKLKSSLSPKERAFAHEIADEFNLNHFSAGAGKSRCVVLSRKRISDEADEGKSKGKGKKGKKGKGKKGKGKGGSSDPVADVEDEEPCMQVGEQDAEKLKADRKKRAAELRRAKAAAEEAEQADAAAKEGMGSMNDTKFTVEDKSGDYAEGSMGSGKVKRTRMQNAKGTSNMYIKP
eukprot:CAMPEP_0185756614 /NCGR_PEP_ID=MMETSP1174-20130828/15031_1 /TAXON_ID=35687 /ORGANISM="Dictyocha speculum, Strain CCMP1381" /LENGTH=298 /DNA_ID=CAMNT_0028435645 /DNA_START=9 /DNA_END=905 /DNA_ORIENTATION=+